MLPPRDCMTGQQECAGLSLSVITEVAGRCIYILIYLTAVVCMPALYAYDNN